jgi:CelD/BcsL family acetyltransferase involved in cellulose biosynthesis
LNPSQVTPALSLPVAASGFLGRTTPGVMSTTDRGSKIAIENPLDQSSWDAELTASFPAASPFFQSSWIRVLASTYQYTPQFLVRREAGRLCAVLPLMEVRSWLTGCRGVSLPFTDECEALAFDPNDVDSLYRRALEWGRERNWSYLEVRGTRPNDPQAVASLSFFEHALKLENDPAALLPRFDSSVRRALRKAETEGVTVEITNSLEAVRMFYRLLGQTRRRHGLPPQPFEFFRQIHQHLLAPGQGMTVLARWRDQPIAGAIFLRQGTRALYKFGASDDTQQHLRGNNAVMWKAIEHLARSGCTELDFGRTSLTNEGLRRFKRSWGTTERTTEYFRYDLQKNRFVTTPDQAASGLHTRVFRALPLGISRLFGAVTYKHLG